MTEIKDLEEPSNNSLPTTSTTTTTTATTNNNINANTQPHIDDAYRANNNNSISIPINDATVPNAIRIVTPDIRPNVDQQTKPIVGSIVAGSLAGGLGGSVIGMPLFGGVLGGFFGGYIAANRDDNDELGRRVRSVGRQTTAIANNLFDFIKTNKIPEKIESGAATAFEKAKEFEEKSQIGARAAEATSTLAQKIEEINEKHHIKEKIVETSTQVVEKAKQINEQYQVQEKIVQVANQAKEAIHRATSSSSSNGPTNQ